MEHLETIAKVANRRRTKPWPWLLLAQVTAFAALLTGVLSQTCAEGWLSGFTSSEAVTYQAMDSNNNNVVVGGKTTNPASLSAVSHSHYSPTAATSAVVFLYTPGVITPSYGILINKFGTDNVNILGVRAVALHKSSSQWFAVFETDIDSSEVLFGYFNWNYPSYSLQRVNVAGLRSWHLQFESTDNIWFWGSRFQFGAYQDYSIKMRIYVPQGYVDNYKFSTQTESEMIDFTLNLDYLIKISKAQCGQGANTFTGILIRVIRSHSFATSITSIDTGVCLNPAASSFAASNVYEAVKIISDSTGLTAPAIFLKESSLKKKFYTVELDLGVKKVTKFYEHGFASGAKFEILHVQSDVVNGKPVFNVVLIDASTSVPWLIKDLSPSSGSRTVYKSNISKISTSSTFTYDQVSTYLGYGFSQNFIYILGKDFLLQFAVATGASSGCLTLGLTNQDSALLTPVLDPNPNIQLDNSSLGNESSQGGQSWYYWWWTFQYYRTGSLFPWKADYCEVTTPITLWAATTRNLLLQTPTAVTASVSVPGCAGQSFTLSQFQYQIVSLQETSTGTTWTNPTGFFQSDPTTNELRMIVDANSSYGVGEYTLSYRAAFATDSVAALNTKPINTVKLTLQEVCDFTMPTASSTAYTYVRTRTPVSVSFSDRTASCPSSSSVLFSNGTALNPNIFNYATATKLLTFASDDPQYEGTYSLRFKIFSLVKPSIFAELTITATVAMSTCLKVWQMPSDAKVLFDTNYVIGEQPIVLSFDRAAISNCPFKLSLWNVTATATNEIVASTVVTLANPVLKVDPTDSMLVSVTTPGRLTIYTPSNSNIGRSTLEVRVTAQRFEGETDYRAFQFTVDAKPCLSLAQSPLIELPSQNYTIGQPALTVAVPAVRNVTCPNGYSTLVPPITELPEGFRVINDTANPQMLQIVLEAASTLKAPEKDYVLEVWELDVFSGQVAKTRVTFSVRQFKFAVAMVVPPLANLTANNVTVPEQAPSANNEVPLNTTETQSDKETTVAAVEVVVSSDGHVTYPWQMQQKQQKKEQKVVVVAEKAKIVPLKATILGMSPTGNLTIVFNKPIYLPPIRVTKVNETATSAPSKRLLTTGSDFQFEIQDLVSIEVQSDFYEADRTEISIQNYTLTRLTERTMDIQINFAQPEKLASSASNPDSLIVKFTQPLIFMDRVDLTQLTGEAELDIAVVPQISQSELKQLEILSDNVSSSMTSLSIGLIVLQVFLAMGLKYLWNIMNLLQFLIYMQMWLISLPPTTQIVLSQLKSLALLEFIPTDWFKNLLKKLLTGDDPAADCESTCAEAVEKEDSVLNEESGIDRVGSSSLLDNMGVMLLLGVLLVTLVLLLVLIRFCRRRAFCEKLYLAFKKKMCYNFFFRYVMQSTLKLQIGACTVIFYDQMTLHVEKKSTDLSSIIVSWIILVVLNICPFFFLSVLYRNQNHLHKPEIIEKIGTLYTGHNAKRASVMTYSFVFLLRRTLFVVITFALFSQPNIQVQLMIFMTLLYIVYIGYSDFFETSATKTLEIFNEAIFCLIQYNFVLLNNLVDDAGVRSQLGNLIVAFTGLLLLVNMAVIIVVSIKALIRKCYLIRLKKQRLEEWKMLESRRAARRAYYLEAAALQKQQSLSSIEDVSRGNSSVELSGSASSSQNASQSSSSLQLESIGDEDPQALINEEMERRGFQAIGGNVQQGFQSADKTQPLKVQFQASAPFHKGTLMQESRSTSQLIAPYQTIAPMQKQRSSPHPNLLSQNRPSLIASRIPFQEEGESMEPSVQSPNKMLSPSPAMWRHLGRKEESKLQSTPSRFSGTDHNLITINTAQTPDVRRDHFGIPSSGHAGFDVYGQEKIRAAQNLSLPSYSEFEKQEPLPLRLADPASYTPFKFPLNFNLQGPSAVGFTGQLPQHLQPTLAAQPRPVESSPSQPFVLQSKKRTALQSQADRLLQEIREYSDTHLRKHEVNGSQKFLSDLHAPY